MKTDYYKILRVSHTASTTEIKQSFRALALECHPDRNDGCPLKVAEFKRLNEAYQVLMDFAKRREYDFSKGSRFNANRRAPPPSDYRKVYAPRPPPDWKFLWDHQMHYDMHYGDGLKNEAIRMMRKEVERDGDFHYRSPLGKGSSFSRDPNENINPYSKRPQGPPKVDFVYEEVVRDVPSGRDRLMERDRVVHDLHSRRNERIRQQHDTRQQQQQQRAQTTFVTTQPANSPNECAIL